MSRRFKTERKDKSEGNSVENQRAVWLFARHYPDTPTSDDVIRPDSWAVLLTERTVENFKAMALQRDKLDLEEIDLGVDSQDGYDLHIGTLWELILVGYKYTYRRREKVKFSDLQTEWKSFSGQLAGMTEISDEDMDVHGMTLADVSHVKLTGYTRNSRRNGSHRIA